MSDPLKLNELETQTELWLKLKAHFEARLAELREMNDHTKPMEQTEKLRGRVQECKYFLAMGEPSPEVVADDDQ